MRETSCFLLKVLFILLNAQNSFSLRGTEATISFKGDYIRLAKDQVLFKTGDAPEIFCTMEGADHLVFYNKSGYLRELPVESVNVTTIRLKLNKTEAPGKLTLFCSDHSDGELFLMKVLFDNPPDIQDFRCMSKNLVYLDCKWDTKNILAGFNLYAVLNNQPSLVCNIPVHEVNSGSYDLSCIWDKKRSPRFTPEAVTLDLLMEYCNYTHCLNKSYSFNHLSIVKLDPPIIEVGEVLTGRYSRRIDVSGHIPENTFKLLDGVHKRAELWSYPRRRESYKHLSILSTGNGFLVQLGLPCYGQKYEVRVSVITYQALNDEYLSDYASATFKADKFVPEDGEDCEDREVEKTPDIMLNDLSNFRAKFKEEQAQMRRKIGEMKARAGVTDSD